MDGYKANVLAIHTPNYSYPHTAHTYDIVFTHTDRPGREFFLKINRKGEYKRWQSFMAYPICFWENTGPDDVCKDSTIWELNLQSPHIFLEFLDLIIKHYTKIKT